MKRFFKTLATILFSLWAVAAFAGLGYKAWQLLTIDEAVIAQRNEQKKIEAEQRLKEAQEQVAAADALYAPSEPEERVETVVAEETPAPEETPAEEPAVAEAPIMVGDQVVLPGFTASEDENTVALDNTVCVSQNAILVDLSSDRIVAQKGMHDKIYPASMTKIMSVLVAAERIQDVEAEFEMTSDIEGYCLTNGCTAAGFKAGETIKIKDLFFGTILPSGGEAALGLATYTAGSQEAFVELMNQKTAELGLGETTHFTNCIGIYNDDNYSTPYDIAMILKAAVVNPLSREALKAHTYTTTLTEQNPEGIPLSNWFLRRIEDRELAGGVVVAGKTGYVAQSGCCAASYFVSASGTPYICVTVNALSEWECIDDHAALYRTYTR